MDAFEQLLDRHQGPLLRLARSLLGDEHAAQDAVQEGFLRLGREADRLVEDRRTGASLRPWLCTVVRNWCLDRLRRRRGATLEEQAHAADNEPVEAGLAADDQRRCLWAAVEDLPPLERAAVLLRYRDGCDYKAIAGELGKTANHVGVLLNQALKRLRAAPALRVLAEEVVA